MSTPITANMLRRMATLAHNRTFSRREWREYGGTDRELDALARARIVEYVRRSPRGWYPTQLGWARLNAIG